MKLSGPPCPKCGMPCEVREHERITPRLLAQPFYFRRWFWCHNKHCKTTMWSREEDKVLNQPALQRGEDVVMDVLEEGAFQPMCVPCRDCGRPCVHWLCDDCHRRQPLRLPPWGEIKGAAVTHIT